MIPVFDKTIFIVIADADKVTENEWIRDNFGDPGLPGGLPDSGNDHWLKTISAPLSSDNGTTLTHWWCCWGVSQAEYNLLTSHFAITYDASVDTPDTVLAAESLVRYEG